MESMESISEADEWARDEAKRKVKEVQ
jgi:hypothetical protein